METLSEKACINCGNKLTGHKRKFCSNFCKGQKYRSENKEAMAAAKRRLRSQYKAITDKIKLERGCAHCGYNENPIALDFNHIDPTTKSFGIGREYTKITKLMAEIDKCEVLCAICHRIHTHETAGLDRTRTQSSGDPQ